MAMNEKWQNNNLSLCPKKVDQYNVSLFLLQAETLSEGDFVLIHVGYAIQKISEQEAQSSWELLDQMLAMEADASA